MGMTFNMVGGGGGKAVLVITVTNGTATSVTATKSGVSVSLTYSGGIWSAELPSFGIWTVTITDGTHANSATVTASTAGLYTTTIYMPDVPIGYTQLEYLESNTSSGTYINTGWSPGTDAVVTIDCAYVSVDGADGDMGVNGSTNQRFFFPSIRAPQNYFRLTRGSFAGNSGVVKNTNRHIFHVDSRTKVFSIDDVSTAFSATIEANPSPFLLFTRTNSSGSPAAGGHGYKLYSCRLANGDSVARNYVPAQRNSDSELGMYDTANNVFYTNAGTFPFIGGPAV